MKPLGIIRKQVINKRGKVEGLAGEELGLWISPRGGPRGCCVVRQRREGAMWIWIVEEEENIMNRLGINLLRLDYDRIFELVRSRFDRI